MAKTIVLIDDDSDDLDIMKEAIQLVDPSLICISFIYPDEAIRLLILERAIQPDFIFIDINMPRLSGEDCLRELRSAAMFNDTPIIMYSTVMPQGTSSRFLAQGASFTFQKGYRVEQYRLILEQVVFNKISPPQHIASQ